MAPFDRRADEDAEVLPAQVRSDSSDTYWKISGGPPADGLGAVVDTYAVRASAEVEDAQDGGAVSALLIGLLRAGEIDGALCRSRAPTLTSSGRALPRSRPRQSEIRAASGSFYNQTMALAELDLSRCTLPTPGRVSPWSGLRARCKGCGPCRHAAGPRARTGSMRSS